MVRSAVDPTALSGSAPRAQRAPFRLTAVAFGLGLFAATSGPARAGPDKCSVVSLTATCEGNQSTGLRAPNDFPNGITRIVVRNLSAPISTSGASGIKNVHTGALTSASIEFFGDRYALTTAGSGAYGLVLQHTGDVGSEGSGSTFSQGGTGRAGEPAASAALQSHGDIRAGAASGIFVELLGGSGGRGGSSTFASGGNGGGGGAVGAVNVQGSGSVRAQGSQAPAVSVHAQGGAGGDGRGSGTTGSGGHGGDGGAGVQRLDMVTSDDWTVMANADAPQSNSPGIRIEVAGGRGGNGGNGAGSGGHGGKGGDASSESISIGSFSFGTWSIGTRGDGSDAFQLSARGGDGGNAGNSGLSSGAPGGAGGLAGLLSIWNNVAVNVVASTEGTGSSALHLETSGGHGGNGGSSGSDGGAGGTGGNGAGIALGTSRFTAKLSTLGAESPAVLVRSNGGNGGKGGTADVIGRGGDGGAGESGGIVAVRGAFTIDTAGRASAGIAAYSFGGDAGAGGKGFVFASGGSGGVLRPSQPVMLDISGVIRTRGAESYGILAESVAGHGGSGGDSFGAVGFGATPGSAGIGGDVSVTSAADVRTEGDQAIALVAGSFGGGGGVGGSAIGAYLAHAGNGSSGGDGGIVGVQNSGKLVTAGQDAHGILATSVGGTGGVGGSTIGFVALAGKSEYGGSGGPVSVTNTGSITTGAAAAPGAEAAPPTLVKICGVGCSAGILAQSIGGGGGDAGSSVGLFSIGGHGGVGGQGGDVSVRNTGAIDTSLASSPAIEAQSVGGGGGNGGVSGGGGVPLASVVSVAVGGAGGTGGRGGDVRVELAPGAALTTRGDDSKGMLVQSIGGGGGKAGFAVTLTASPDLPTIGLAVGGSGGDGGGGGRVDVLDGTPGTVISTFGTGSGAIHAQSVGGGGGNGGFALEVAPSAVGAFSASVGGSGGKGGSGAAVQVATGALVSTAGDGAAAIFAHSVGGGGGDGLFAISGAFSPASASFSVGGSGGSAGKGDVVLVRDFGGTLLTQGKGSTGIDAQSIGGGGGSGGFSVDASAGIKGAVAVAVGGGGAGGGSGSAVRVENLAAITTLGPKSSGIAAQSIGGGGGHGGLTLAGDVSQLGAGGLSVSVGRGGGNGGVGDLVTVINGGEIAVHGAGSVGIAAQSTGMGGGDGGMSLSGTLGGGGGAKQISVSVGGGGGNGGGSKGVEVINTAAISTGGLSVAGAGSIEDFIARTGEHGILAQSVGGGGGVGGFVGTLNVGRGQLTPDNTLNLNVAVGGFGGHGGAGGAVRVDNRGTIATTSADSNAISAQSIGGPGGQGGAAMNYAVEAGQPPRTTVINLAFALGGFGGDGNIGGAVTAINSARLETAGASAHGIAAKSVGGGGGTGGSVGDTVFSMAGFRPDKDEASVKLTVGVGGFGGKANDGGAIVVDNAGDIVTRGGGSMGIDAYSIGGGGGDGGDASSLEQQFPAIPFVDRVKTFRNVSISVGGLNGATGNGNTVTVTQRGAVIETEGPGAPAILAQSVGGGGGRGGTATGSLTTPSVSVGGTGGAGGNGGDVTVSLLGGAKIATRGGKAGDPASVLAGGSFGIFAQSVGGGGGLGGNAKLQGIPSLIADQFPKEEWMQKVSIGIGLPIALPGGAGGNGGAVSVKVEGEIHTEGDSAAAIFAQSVGGGGGFAGAMGLSPVGLFAPIDAYHGALIGSASAPGSAGAVNVDVNGIIETQGAAAHGILATSAGGGKKLAATPNDSADLALGRSTGGDVTIRYAGQLRAAGIDAVGILAHSEGGEGNGNISISVAPGSLVSGGLTGKTNPGTGILVMAGRDNLLTNAGTLTSRQRIGVTSLGSGRLTIDNSGTIDGDVLLSPGANRFNNLPTGVVLADRIELGGGVMHNEGVLSPGGIGRVAATHFEGQLVQTASSALAIDLDDALRGTAGHADLLELSGATTLSGRVLVNLTGLGKATTGERTVTLVQSAAGLSTDNLTVLSATGSHVVRYRLVQPSTDRLALAYDVDFANDAVLAHTNANQAPLARRMQAFYGAGTLDGNLALKLAQASAAMYARDLDQLGAEIAVDSQIASLQAALRFGGDLRRCSTVEARCTWAHVTGLRSKYHETSDNAGYTSDSGQVVAGGEVAVDGGWRIGGALGWERSTLRTAAAAASHGDRLQVGLSARRAFGAAELSGSLSIGEARNDLSRQLPEGGATVEAKESVRSAAAWLGGAYTFGDAAVHVKPRLDLGVVGLRMPGFDERGSEPLRLRVGARSDTYTVLQPGIEMGAEFTQDDGTRVRPRMALAISQFIGPASPAASASFAGDPVDAAPFTTTTRLARTQYALSAGLQMSALKGAVVTADALVSGSAHTRGYGLSVRVEVPF